MFDCLLSPTLDDVDLVLSWLPRHGAEEFRARLIGVRNALLTQPSRPAGCFCHPAHPVDDIGILTTWLGDIQQELENADTARARQIETLLKFLDQ